MSSGGLRRQECFLLTGRWNRYILFLIASIKYTKKPWSIDNNLKKALKGREKKQTR